MCFMHHARWKRHGDALKTLRPAKGAVLKFLKTALLQETDACIDWPFCVHPFGYGIIYFKGRTSRVHNLVCRWIYGPPEHETMEVAHSCNNRRCVNKRHLRWTTRSENQMDRVQHGTSNRGTRQWNHKLTEKEVRLILLKTKTPKALAKQFGVVPRTIRDVLNRKTWAWVTHCTMSDHLSNPSHASTARPSAMPITVAMTHNGRG